MSLDVSTCESSDYKMWARIGLPTGSVGKLQGITQCAAASFIADHFIQSEHH